MRVGDRIKHANAELFAASNQKGRFIAEEMATSRVQWKFNTLAAPHFGGLWKAMVKSTKYLHKIIGSITLYEEMVTLLAQVEA